MGKLHEIPVDKKFASTVDPRAIANPYELADTIRRSKYEHRVSHFPHRPIFGGDSPKSVAYELPL